MKKRPQPSREELLDMMRAVAAKLDLRQLPQQTFLKHAGVSRGAVDRHYDTWADACRAADISHGRTLAEMPRQQNYTKEDCLAEMRRVATLLNKKELSSKVYGGYAQISVKAITRRFGSWRAALTAAGLTPTAASERLTLPTRDHCVAELQRVARFLGRDHLTSAAFDESAQVSAFRVVRVFGSWHAALQEAGLAPSPHFIREVPLATLADDFLRVSIELGRLPTINQLTRRSAHVSHTFGSGKPGGYRAFKLRAIAHLFATTVRVPPAIKQLFEAELAAAPPRSGTSSVNPRRDVMTTATTRDELVQRGSLACLADQIQEWDAPALEKELEYSDALAAHLRKALPDAHVEREYRHEGTTCDIRVGFSQEDEVLVEVKWQLQRKSDYDRLVGQIEGLKPQRNKLMVVLIGDTNQQLVGRLKQQYDKYLSKQPLVGAETTFMIVNVGSHAPRSGHRH